METPAFIEALTETLFISIAQAFVILLFFRTMFSAVPGVPSQIKFNIWYSSLLLISGLFVYSLLSIYAEKVQITSYMADSAILSDRPTSESPSWFNRMQSWEARYAGSITVFYFAGVGIHLISLLISWFKSRLWISSQVSINDSIWMTKLNLLRKKSGIIKHVSLQISHKIAVPVTMGFIKPIILLPVSTVSNLSILQVEAILLHELAHIKRNDYLLNIFQKVMESLLFFNPFVWLIKKEIQKEREFCCDEMVVAHTNDPLTYAKALLHLEEHKNSIRLALAANGSGKYPLLNRIKRITVMNNPDPSQKTGLLTIATVFFVGISLALALPVSKKDIQMEIIREIPKSTLLSDKIFVNNQGPVEPFKKPYPVERFLASKPDSLNDTGLVKKQEWRNLQQELKKTASEMNKQGQEQSNYADTDEWNKHRLIILKHTDEIKKHFEGPEWRELQKQLSEQGQLIAKQITFPEWKDLKVNIRINKELLVKNAENVRLNIKMAELNKKMTDLHEVFETPEWNSKLEEIQKSAEVLEMKFNSAELKQKEIELERKAKELSELGKRLEESPEIKQNIKKLEKTAKEIERNMKNTK